MNEIFEEQMTFGDYNSEYDAFVEKFKPKKTTDDCYTPPKVYDAVQDWACKQYNINPASIVQPFCPGGDYERFTYPDGCVVLDNPPFSILTKICEFYLDRDIPFFLFAPSLTAFSGRKTIMRIAHIIPDAEITYENGAVVRTAFVTNLAGDIILQTAPDLYTAIAAAQKSDTVSLPKYDYPGNVVTAAMVQKYAKRGIEFVVRAGECTPIYALDAQKVSGKRVFGSGLLVSDRLAADRLAADRLAKERLVEDRFAEERLVDAQKIIWELSPRERETVEWLNRGKRMEGV